MEENIMNPYLRRAKFEDLTEIMDIIDDGRKALEKNGIPQWKDGDGPNHDIFLEDIKNQEAYVMILNKKIIGIASIISKPEAPYKTIENGKWDETQNSYVSIHRVAIDTSIKGKGLSNKLLELLINTASILGYIDIRIDTHPKNLIMQRVIKNAGFVEKGDILLPVKNGERKAFQLILD
ncbi:GNAT family N-acetyltransferase [Clostridium argentinense]|nr:GNAT family N-acetyltransferase [Clostridium argentinense]NFP50511.1 GNAT family N-acetyltransferase [Clostridium argentinense]NFP72883.1 GNAT family N-acetyltransferase [Clostridium argentinense]NFP77605.1 GNAT family N-acetyltransferase [Clostridium argentinense]